MVVDCDKYLTISERKGQLTSQGRCFTYLRVGNLCKECPSVQNRSCYYCNRTGHHHCSICPKQFGRVASSTDNQASVNLSSQNDSVQSVVCSS